MLKTKEEIAMIINLERNKRSLSQVELAQMSGLSQTTITAIENCHINARLNTLMKISSALGIDYKIFLKY